MFPFSWKYKYLVHFIKCKEIRSSVNRRIMISWQDFQMYVLRFFILASSPPSLSPSLLTKVVIYGFKLFAILKCGSTTFSSFPSQPWRCLLKCGITRNITYQCRKCLAKITLVTKLKTAPPQTIFKIHQFDPLIKICGKNHSWIQRFYFLYCLSCRKHSWEKSWSGLHGGAIWKAWSMQFHLEPNKLAILCLFPKHSHLFAFPKCSCFNILQQPSAICLAMCPFLPSW